MSILYVNSIRCCLKSNRNKTCPVFASRCANQKTGTNTETLFRTTKAVKNQVTLFLSQLACLWTLNSQMALYWEMTLRMALITNLPAIEDLSWTDRITWLAKTVSTMEQPQTAFQKVRNISTSIDWTNSTTLPLVEIASDFCLWGKKKRCLGDPVVRIYRNWEWSILAYVFKAKSKLEVSR